MRFFLIQYRHFFRIIGLENTLLQIILKLTKQNHYLRMLISVVDDDPVFQFLCRAYFAHCSENVPLLSFNDGHAAWLYFKDLINTKSPIPKLILIDINMPLMDGWTLVDEIDKLGILGNAHIYMVSSSISISDRDRSLSKPLVKDYLKKPLNLMDFKRIYQNALDDSDTIR